MNVDQVLLPLLVLLVAVAVLASSWVRLRSLLTRDHPSNDHAKLRRRVEASVLVLLGLVAASLLVTTGWNAIAMRRFWTSHPPAGLLLPVNGHNMHIDCTGTSQPTLVLEAGLGDDSLIWANLQPTLANFTRTCSYDRAGLGWSEGGSAPRDADSIAAALHGLLTKAGITGPLVLMGHSIGGLYIRDYVIHYPANVVGMVLLDSTSPYLNKDPAFAAETSLPPSWLIRLAMAAGLPRVFGMCSKDPREIQPRWQKLQAEDRCRLHYGEVAGELSSFDQSSEEVARVGSYGSLPLLIFSQDPANPQAKSSDIIAAAEWNRLQERLKILSTNSRRVIVPGSTHYVMLHRPDFVDAEMSSFLHELRARMHP